MFDQAPFAHLDVSYVGTHSVDLCPALADAVIFSVIVQDDNAAFGALVAGFNVVDQHFAAHGGYAELFSLAGFLTHLCLPGGGAQGG